MSEATSTDKLSEAIIQAAKAIQLPSTADPWVRSSTIIQAIFKVGTPASTVREIIKEDASFGLLRGGWLSWGGGGMLMQEHVLPLRLIDAAMTGEDFLGIIGRARQFAVSCEAASEVYAPLVGITVSEIIELSDNAALIPWSEVPDGEVKKMFGGEHQNHFVPFSFPKPVPTCAIRVSLPRRKILFASNEEAGAKIEATSKDVTQAPIQVADLVRCAVALSEHTVVAAGSWFYFTDPTARLVASTGYSWSHEYADTALTAAGHAPAEVEGQALRTMFDNFAKLRETERGALSIALDRINASLRRSVLVDKAIDLGIALEAMVLHDNSQDSDRGELRYRTAIRGATFLGGTREQRKQNFKVLREAYDLRSEAVHVGKLDEQKKRKRRDATPILTDGYKLALAIIRKIIGIAHFPAWEDNVLFGGE